ncbi:hypothetical protein OY671_007493, partial [Metschnikowia pulcherrima]
AGRPHDPVAGERRAHPLGARGPLPRHARPAGDRSWTVESCSARPFDPERSSRRIEDSGTGRVRSRGVFHVANRPDSSCAWDGAGGQLCIGTLGTWDDATTAEGRPVEPHTRVVVVGATPPDGETGDGVRERVLDAFRDVLATPDESADGGSRWLGRTDVLAPWLGARTDAGGPQGGRNLPGTGEPVAIRRESSPQRSSRRGPPPVQVCRHVTRRGDVPHQCKSTGAPVRDARGRDGSGVHTQDSTELGDEQLADAVRAGRAEAFAVLWERHAAAGRSAARRLTATYDPDDLVQEAYSRVLGASQSGHGPTGPFRPYLYTTSRSVAASWARTPDPTPVEDVPEVVDPRDSSTEVLERSVTVRAFRRSPERWQAVLWYTEVEGMEPREAAPSLGLSAAATAALSYRAREGSRREWLQAHVSSDAVAPECRWTVERSGDHARGTSSRAAQDRVEEHLTGCSSCSILAEEVDDVASRSRIVLLPLVLGVPAAVDAATGTLAATTAARGTPTGPAPGTTTGSTTGTTGGGVGGAASGAGAGAAAAGAAVPGVSVGALAAVVVAAVVGVSAVARPWSAADPPAAAAGQQSSAPGLA